MTKRNAILEMYEVLASSLGPSHWWPADTPFEIAIGAILTQNTNWGNVEKAIHNLKERDVLNPHALLELPTKELAQLIYPAGYYNVKAVRIKHFLEFLAHEVDCDMSNLQEYELLDLRRRLLKVKGIGPETADSILLYALNLPTFVVDAYTLRLAQRHGLAYEGIDYHELREIFMDALPEDVALYNEYHALIVRAGKEWCKKKTGLCTACPLNIFLDH